MTNETVISRGDVGQVPAQTALFGMIVAEGRVQGGCQSV
jgi:hypothetical protein